MKKIAILIGFCYKSYENDLDRKHLPGIILDLYNIYNLITNAKYDKIIIITDIESDIKSTELYKIMSIVNVNNKFKQFIKNLIYNNEYYLYQSKILFIKQLNDLLINQDKVFIYYTGHYKHKNFILPYDKIKITEDNMVITYSQGIPESKKQAKISQYEILEIILMNVQNTSEIFMIMDCCNGVDFGFPFILQKNTYRFCNNKINKYLHQKIICITSSFYDQSSIATNKGSVFSTLLVDQLTNCIWEKRKLSNILKNITIELEKQNIYNQQPMITSTYNTLYKIERWVLFSNSITIKIDNEKKIIKVKN